MIKVKSVGAARWLNLTTSECSVLFACSDFLWKYGTHMEIPLVEFGDTFGVDTQSQLKLGKLSNNKVIFGSFSNELAICYGMPDIEIGEPYNYCLKGVYFESTPERFKVRHLSGGKHYVYTCKLDGVVVYVGKGVGSRINHLGKTKGHNKKLTSAIRSAKDVCISKIAENLTDEMATYLEESFIRACLMSGNSLFNVNKPKWLSNELEQK